MTRSLVAAALAMLVAFSLAPRARAADAAPAASAGESIAWETSYAATLKKAGADAKPVLLKFYTGWCPFCTKMDKTTWVDGKVAEAAKAFACGKVNADVEAPAVARYRTTGYPTVILAEPGGEPIIRLEGYKDPALMATLLTSFASKKDALTTAAASLKKDKKDAGAALTLADFQASVGLHDQAADAYVKVTKSAQGPDFVRASAGAGRCLTKAGKAEQAGKILAKAAEAAGATPSPALMLALGENEMALGNPEKGKTWLNRVLAEAPGTPEAADAKAALGG